MNKVLIIEDDSEQSFLYQTVFNISGLSAISVSNRDEAMKEISGNRPDIILTDIMLRGENGLDIVEEIKQDDGMKSIPVFVFTNTNKDEYKKRAHELGAVAYIIKSETIPQEMAERIKSFLGGLTNA